MIQEVQGKAVVQIKPIIINALKGISAHYLGVKIINDNLLNEATFQWTLYTNEMLPLDNDIIMCDGEDYENWDNSNQQAFEYVLSQMFQIEVI